MKKMALATTLAALFAANVQADTVGLYLGGQIWQSEVNGIFGELNTLVDFNLKEEQQIVYFVAIEHPFSWLPNARISSTTLDTTGKTTLTQEFSFGGETFSIGNDVDASFNVSYIDYTLYYELFDNDLFSIDLGLTARDFNGDVTVSGTTTIDNGSCNDPNPSPDSPCTGGGNPTPLFGKIKTNKVEPMLYVASNISLPLIGLSLFAQGDFLFIDSHSLSDYQVGLSYELINNRMMDLNLALGYRVVEMEFENLNNLSTNLEFKGTYAGVIAHF
ncbi:TIGR04219 family outer membrane beta-barrel protein [Thalassotalea ganghwensis]